MAQKICQLCGKPYIAISHNQKYCCKKCRFTAMEARTPKKQSGRRPNPKTGQPCWRCQNATDMNKCPWSIGILPKGCVATKVIRYPDESNTYKVLNCPMFKEDDY